MISTTTENYNGYDNDFVPMTTNILVPSAIGITILIIAGITGNLMTIFAYFADSRLNTVYDFFIFNLALTDLLLSCVSMPFYAVYDLMEFSWPFGYAFCKIWMVIDFTLCFESIVIMLILSLDRLLMVSIGPLYLQKCTKRIAVIQIAISWIVSFLVYGPAIIGWNHWVGYSILEENDCDVEFAYDHTFTTATSFVEFILPFVCLTLINALIYLKIRKRMKVKPSTVVVPQATASTSFTDDKPTQDIHSEKCTLNEGKGARTKRNYDSEIHLNKTSKNPRDNVKPKVGNRQREKPDTKSLTHGHIKAAKFLAMLVIAFLVFWAPYTVTTVIISFCDDCVNISLYEFFNWLLWMKSAVNPFLYAYNSPRYRKQFEKFLTLNGKICKKRRAEVEQLTAISSIH